jgi:hypothetical protein
MPREREGFRDNMERLNEFFPNRELLNVSDLVSFTGRNREVVKKLFDFKNGYISKVEVARTLS